MFVLAHLSDPHLGPLPRARMRELASKRMLGFVNWRRGRMHALAGPVLMYWLLVHVSGIPLLEQHLAASRPDAFRRYAERVPAFFPRPPRD